MRILLDENFPPRLQKDFVNHECSHVIGLGWRGIFNGELLERAELNGFNVLVTLDSNIPDQNEVKGRAISVYVLQPEGQGTQAARALIGDVLIALDNYKPGHVEIFNNRKNDRRREP